MWNDVILLKSLFVCCLVVDVISAGRLYETSELSDTALSHHVQRTVQPSKCSHCDTLSILYTVQCIDCGSQWHKTCFPKLLAIFLRFPQISSEITTSNRD
ncbi:hypothetical protein DICVIV_08316 [Dictyocaulus viviparus]|uniref:Phorbol-ester/DAG-type domain-containing protein n=1 Tax=Dictyocaulus viviparus TaxID=29172 RepID=A0A0D8XLW3_DICVI|nr:hypothetical protein DICVIV_08316 [Dictyocaulus viviparus]